MILLGRKGSNFSEFFQVLIIIGASIFLAFPRRERFFSWKKVSGGTSHNITLGYVLEVQVLLLEHGDS